MACHNLGGCLRNVGGGGEWGGGCLVLTESCLALPIITRADYNMHQLPEGKHLQVVRSKKRQKACGQASPD